MNERIKLLIMKAGGIICSDVATGTIEKIDYLHFDAEKFAELMLKASFDVVINDGRFHDAKGIIKAGKYTAMEHFGVEE